MRLFWIGLPAGLALASAGLLLYRQGLGPHSTSVDLVEAPVRHFATKEMFSETSTWSKRVAPAFELKDTKDETVVLGSPAADRPQFIYFVVDGCPCSFEAEPLLHDLAEHFRGQVDFVSVTDAEPKKALKWTEDMIVPYPVISDPKKEIIHAYQAKNSIYSALVSRDGRIVKMWPGYSKSILLEMNSLFAKVAGVKEKPFDTKYAPIESSTGCSF